MMLPFFDPEHADLQARVRAWAREHLAQHGGHDAGTEQRAMQLARDLGAAGFLKHTVPLEFGGSRAVVQVRDLCIVREELARADALADTIFAVQALGSFPITLAGSPAQRNAYLPRVADGTSLAAFAITEAEAGSDPASMQTRARREAGRYSITGSKRFISNAGIADFYIVFASTEPEKKAKGISVFLLEASTPGLRIQEKTEMLSPHPIGALEFAGCTVSETALVGGEGAGLKIALATLDKLRCTVAAAAVGLAQRALQEALRYGRTRRQFGRAIAEFQGTEFKLADMVTELEAARLLVYQAAWAHDRSEGDAGWKSSMAKMYATEAAQRIVDQALQIHGGSGLIAGSIMERLYRDVRALRIYEGTTEIQKIIIARELLAKSKVDQETKTEDRDPPKE